MPFAYPSQSGYSQSPQSVPAIASRTCLNSSSLGSVCARGGPAGASEPGAGAAGPFASAGAAPSAPAGAGASGSFPLLSDTRMVSSIALVSAPPGAHFSVLMSLPCAIAFEYPKQSGYPQSPQSVPAIASSSTFCNCGLSSLTCSALAASARPIAVGSSPAAFGLPCAAPLSPSSCSLVGKGGGGASHAAITRRVISPNGLRGKASAPLGGL